MISFPDVILIQPVSREEYEAVEKAQLFGLPYRWCMAVILGVFIVPQDTDQLPK